MFLLRSPARWVCNHNDCGKVFVSIRAVKAHQRSHDIEVTPNPNFGTRDQEGDGISPAVASSASASIHQRNSPAMVAILQKQANILPKVRPLHISLAPVHHVVHNANALHHGGGAQPVKSWYPNAVRSRKFRCPQCPKAFTAKSNLEYHWEVHASKCCCVLIG